MRLVKFKNREMALVFTHDELGLLKLVLKGFKTRDPESQKHLDDSLAMINFEMADSTNGNDTIN